MTPRQKEIKIKMVLLFMMFFYRTDGEPGIRLRVTIVIEINQARNPNFTLNAYRIKALQLPFVLNPISFLSVCKSEPIEYVVFYSSSFGNVHNASFLTYSPL